MNGFRADALSMSQISQQQSIFHDFYIKLKSDKAQPVRKVIENFVKEKLPVLIKN
jgi:hypothetical protein